jgi:Spy/CpxP family protein refolding chaperone
MTNSGLTAADVLSLTKDNDGFGGVGLIILLFIFLMAISGNGFGFGNNNAAFGMADLQASLYNQTQDANSRQIQSSIASLNDSVLNNKYDNAILIKDLSNQMSNSVAAIGNQIANQTATITNLFNQQTIDHLREVNTNLSNNLNNQIQTAQITENILSNLATTNPKPPCYYSYGCGCGCNSLY